MAMGDVANRVGGVCAGSTARKCGVGTGGRMYALYGHEKGAEGGVGVCRDNDGEDGRERVREKISEARTWESSGV